MMNNDYTNNILESISSGVAMYEYNGEQLKMIYFNNRVCRALGYSREKLTEICKEDAFLGVHPDDIAKLSDSFRQCLSGNSGNAREVRFIKRDNSVVWVKCHSKLISQDNNVKRFVVTYIDITEEIITKEELSFRANHDPLTSIFNADAFYAKTRELINENPDKDFVLVRINIVKFKVINDIFGTKTADEILISAARFLEKALSDSTAAYGRITSDHFAFCLSKDLFDEQELIDGIQKFSHSFPEYLNLSFKAGIYEITDRAISVAVMCDRAKLAMQAIKNDTSKLFAYYNDEIRQNMLMEQRIEGEMQWALDNEQFEVWLQPIYSLTSMQPYSAEALVRWRHPTKGLISPGMFIPIFEKNGFIRKLDSYVFEHVCAYIRKRLDNGQHLVPISVNISRMSLYSEDLATEIIGVVEKYGLSPDLFKIEITETAYNNYPQILLNTINKLRSYGFTILMDDFGSGYSSLNTLKDLPIDVLKIDMNFMSDFSVSDKSTNILASIVRMAKWLDMPCIAEGVETEMQVDFLKSIGCENIQGFYFSKPLPQEDFEKVIDLPASPSQHYSDREFEAISEDVDAMLTGNQTVTRLMNGLFGAMGFYEFSGDNLEVIRVNDGYYRVLGYSLTEFARDAKNILGKIYKNDISVLKNAIRQSSETKSAVRITLRRFNSKGELLYLDASVSRFGGTDEKQLICIAFNNITEHIMLERKNSEKTRLLNFIARRLLEHSGLDYAINDILRVVRKYYNSEMASTFNLDNNDADSFIFYENTAKNPGSISCDIQKLPYDKCRQFIEVASKSTVLRIDSIADSSELSEQTRELLAGRGLSSLIALPVFDKEYLLGVICIGNPKANLDQIDFLESLGYYFSLAAVKYRMQKISEGYNSQMNAIIDNMLGGVGLFEISESGEIGARYISDNFLRISGISKGTYITDIASIADPRDRDSLEEAIRSTILLGSSMTEQFRANSDSEEEKWISLSCSVVPDPESGNSMMVAVINDITVHVKEEQIRYNEALSSVFDRIYRIDMSRSHIELVSSNDEKNDTLFNRFLGTFGDSEEMVKQRKWLAKMCKQAYIDHVHSCEYSIELDNETKWAELLFVKLTATEYLMCILDVTQKKATEDIRLENEKLRLQEQFHESESIYVHQTGVAIIEFDYRTHKVTATDNYRSFAASRLIDNPDLLRSGNIGSMAHPDDIAALTAMFTTPDNMPPIEARLLRNDGEYVWCQINKTIIKDEDGKPQRAGYTILDINSRKLSEQKLRETSDRLSNIVDNANSGIVLFELDDQYRPHTLYANDMYYSILCYSKEDYISHGLDLTQIIKSFDSEAIENILRTTLSQGKPHTTEVQIMCGNGSRKWLKLDFAPYVSSDSKESNRRSVMIATDITTLKETSLRLSTVLSTAGNGIVLVDIGEGGSLNTVYANPKFLELNGYDSSDEINAKTGGILDLVHPDDAPTLMAKIGAALKTLSPMEHDYRIVTKDGSVQWRHIAANLVPSISNERPLYLAMFTDITEIKTMGERFETVISAIPGAAAYYKIRGYEVVSEYYAPNAMEICQFDDEKSFEEFRTKVHDDARFITPHNMWGGLVDEAKTLSSSGGKIVLKNILANGKDTPIIMYGLTTDDRSAGYPVINLLLIVPPDK